MPPPLFVFVQIDFPWSLGPAEGRYLLRERPGAEPERVLVMQTVRDGERSATRITLIDPVSLPAESQARAWLEDLERDSRSAIEDALHYLNRVVHLHRIATADPYVRELPATQARAIRAGWGTGEQLAAGRYSHARELPVGAGAGKRRGLLRRGRRRERVSALTAQERLASLLGAHVPPLLSEELALRARLDFDQGRLGLAALELTSALSTAVAELRGERREDLALRIDELERLRPGVEALAQKLRDGAQSPPPGAVPPPGAPAAADRMPDASAAEDPLEHALGRLEAALRARAAGKGAVRGP